MITFQQLGRLGRFGNQLFQIASTIGIARKHGYDFAFPEWRNYDHMDRFGSTEDCDVQKYFVNKLPEAPSIEFDNLEIPWGYSNTYVPDNVSLHGHMQSDKYFKHCIDEVRHYLKMKDEIPLPDCTAIHLRRGDYDNAYHPIIDFEYYMKAAELTPCKWFYIFSDSSEAACRLSIRLYQKFGIETVIRTGDYLEDFNVMKKCSYFICANSTFSLMAAILSEAPDKKIVCPSNWFGAAWGLGYKEMSKDIYPENSIII